MEFHLQRPKKTTTNTTPENDPFSNAPVDTLKNAEEEIKKKEKEEENGGG
ncbi:MAG: hypothetical protein ACOVQA_05705 [Thermoflexibacteraceae bacterium]